MKLFVIFILSIILCQAVARQLLPTIPSTVVGTNETTIENYPYVVSVQTPGIFGRRHNCAGIIISTEWILTEAHCLVQFDHPRAFRVRVGGTKHDGSTNFTDYSGIEKYLHPDYEYQKLENDIGLLKVDTPILLSDSVKSVSLANLNDEISVGDLGVIVGWGRDPSITLNKMNVKVISQEDCQTHYTFTITENMICVLPESIDTIGICQSDTGNPFVSNDNVVGVTALALGCASPGSPAILTKVSSMANWISEITSL